MCTILSPDFYKATLKLQLTKATPEHLSSTKSPESSSSHSNKVPDTTATRSWCKPGSSKPFPLTSREIKRVQNNYKANEANDARCWT